MYRFQTIHLLTTAGLSVSPSPKRNPTLNSPSLHTQKRTHTLTPDWSKLLTPQHGTPYMVTQPKWRRRRVCMMTFFPLPRCVFELDAELSQGTSFSSTSRFSKSQQCDKTSEIQRNKYHWPALHRQYSSVELYTVKLMTNYNFFYIDAIVIFNGMSGNLNLFCLRFSSAWSHNFISKKENEDSK